MMNKEQIEEMAKTVCHLDRTCDECMTSFECKAMTYAKRFYNAGYRKQSESVIELPCKVGDIVWWADTEFEELLEGEVVSFPLQKEGLWAYCRYRGGLTYWHLVSDYFGNTVFLTKEEAERKMKGGAE